MPPSCFSGIYDLNLSSPVFNSENTTIIREHTNLQWFAWGKTENAHFKTNENTKKKMVQSKQKGLWSMRWGFACFKICICNWSLYVSAKGGFSLKEASKFSIFALIFFLCSFYYHTKEEEKWPHSTLHIKAFEQKLYNWLYNLQPITYFNVKTRSLRGLLSSTNVKN